MEKSNLNEEQILQTAELKWKQSTDLREEFGSFERFLAWRKAEASGRARILEGRNKSFTSAAG